MKSLKHVDRPFLIITILLVGIGFFIFSSASLGLLSREGARFSSVAFSQFFFGVCGGFLALSIFSRVPYRSYRPFIPHIFIGALLLTLFVFIPGLGYEANGAKRWISIFGLSMQPGEVLKIAFVLFLAWYYSMIHKKIDKPLFAFTGLSGALLLSAIVLLLQPDTGTFLIMATAGFSIVFVAGLRWRHIALLVVIGLLGLVILALSRPYLLERIETFKDPTSDPSGAGYQLKQSLIAVGSGGWFGKGYGQSVQKFTYLPEPIGDSIFSVAAEEFGFAGSVAILLFFILFTIRGLFIASRAPDRFGGLTVVGIVILVMTQACMNIASMIGLIPLTGEPLPFISHGGTSLLIALAGVGIILNVSRYAVEKGEVKKV